MVSLESGEVPQLWKQANVVPIFKQGDKTLPYNHRSFNYLLGAHNLHNHVTFPTHRSGSILNPVVMDGAVGSLDPDAILTRINFRRIRNESSTHTLWQWEDTNSEQFCRCLATTVWTSLLQGDVD